MYCILTTSNPPIFLSPNLRVRSNGIIKAITLIVIIKIRITIPIHFPNNEIETSLHFITNYPNNGIEILVHKFIPFHRSLAIHSPKHSLGIFTNLLQYSTATLYYCPLFGFSLSFQPIAANQHFYTLTIQYSGPYSSHNSKE